MLTVVTAYFNSEKVREFARWALRTMVARNTVTKIRAGHADAVDAVLQAMTIHHVEKSSMRFVQLNNKGCQRVPTGAEGCRG